MEERHREVMSYGRTSFGIGCRLKELKVDVWGRSRCVGRSRINITWLAKGDPIWRRWGELGREELRFLHLL